jgi:hypothetical protein
MNMRKRIIALILAVAASVLLVSCAAEKPTEVKLTIVETAWNSRTEPAYTETRRDTARLCIGDNTAVEWNSCDALITIKDITDDGVVVRFTANGVAPSNERGNFDFAADDDWTVTIKYGDVYYIGTQTLDAGTIWALVFEKL